MTMARGRGCRWLIAVALGVGWGAAYAHAECAPFYESFNSLASLTANGGTVSPTVTFAAGVSGNAATWNSTGHVTYSAPGFRTAAGSLTLWYKKTTSTVSGGIAQIGTLGTDSSLGLFYLNTDDLGFEMRSSTGTYQQIYVADVLPLGVWTHIAVAWRERTGACDMWVYINGSYRDYAALTGTWSHAATTLQVGTTGYYGHGRGATDELRWFDWSLLDSEVYAEYVYSSNRFLRQVSSKPVSTGPVQVIGNCLYVNGEPFKVKGVGYAPTPIGAGTEYSIYTNAAILARDVPVLKGMNINTIRTWAQPPNSMLMDAMYTNGGAPIYTIVGFWVPNSGIDYADPAVITQYENSFRNLVNQFKNHPGLLAWGIGNEVNLSLSGQALADWYALANHLAEVAYVAEGTTYHPTIVVNGGLYGLGNVDYGSDDVSLPAVDLWGQNTYFGWDAHCFFDYYDRLSAKPLLFTEYGIDAWNNVAGAEYQDVQAAWVVRQWRQIESATLGGTIMAYSDEWWKAGSPSTHDTGGYSTGVHPDGFSNEEYWGMVWVQDQGSSPDLVHPRLVYTALGQEYATTAGDYDGDGDVDLQDIAAFQQCFGGAATGMCGIVFDAVVDDVIDLADFAALAPCIAGPGESPACCP
jgi:hypothetical protein